MRATIAASTVTGDEDRCPLQIEGTLSTGERFYFRARQASIALGIGPTLDDAAAAAVEAIDRERGRPTTYPHAVSARGTAVQLDMTHDQYPVDRLTPAELDEHLHRMLTELTEPAGSAYARGRQALTSYMGDVIGNRTAERDNLIARLAAVRQERDEMARRLAHLRAALDVERTAPCTGCETAYDTCELGPGIKCCPDCAHVVPAKRLAEALDGWRAADGSGGVRTTGQDDRRITEIRREAGLP